MKSLESSSKYIRIRSHLYFHCRNCNGIFLYKGKSKNHGFRVIDCFHCRYRIQLEISLVNECDNARTVWKFAAIVQKEEPMEKMLMIVRKHKNGVNKRKLVTILMKRGYREKVIGQLTYLGLIAESNDGGSFYSITEKGCKVLVACGH